MEVSELAEELLKTDGNDEVVVMRWEDGGELAVFYEVVGLRRENGRILLEVGRETGFTRRELVR